MANKNVSASRNYRYPPSPVDVTWQKCHENVIVERYTSQEQKQLKHKILALRLEFFLNFRIFFCVQGQHTYKQ
jgi:hypothetical protein